MLIPRGVPDEAVAAAAGAVGAEFAPGTFADLAAVPAPDDEERVARSRTGEASESAEAMAGTTPLVTPKMTASNPTRPMHRETSTVSPIESSANQGKVASTVTLIP